MQTHRSQLARIVDARPVAAFAAFAIGLSWTAWVGTYSVVAPRSGLGLVGGALGAFGPAAAGAIVTRLRGESVRSWLTATLDWRRKLRWYGLALAVPAVATVGVAAVVFALADVPDAASIARLAPLFGVNLILATLFTGGNEELGWRGFALPRLQRRYSALTAALVVGAIWAVWHAPMFAFGVYRLSPVLYAASVCCFSVVLTWYYNASDGCVPGAMLLHGTLNAAVNIPGQAVGGVDALPIPYAAVLTGVFAVVAGLIVARYGAETLARGGAVARGGSAVASADRAASEPDRSVSVGTDSPE
ncbi:CPBP family intramembrane glutamic endopeptidase [Halorubrum sodomense]|uniref:CAAX protease self-immunity n=1 Tax=Halorubrum sodomense TaxID=35743 RepID=A0A1I6FK83_HALSD|nr:CPBP family intramembrane glutamic endopeptidase [Halorubrum sodomense]SFR30360.1 CAAX protease self-immunity [Halorubrum sodomense]